MTLRRHLAYWALGIVAFQLMISNVAFLWYGRANHWDIDSQVMIAWLAAAVLEVVGIMAVIAQNLFPNGGGKSKS